MNMFKDSSVKGKIFKGNSSIVIIIYAIIILILIYSIFVFLYNMCNRSAVINVSNMIGSNKTNQTQLSPVSDFYKLKLLSEGQGDINVKSSIYIPDTRDEKLNKYIEINIDKYIADFNNLTKGKELSKYSYVLDIFFDTYLGENGKYISFVFHIFMDTGGAHPNTYIWSAVYDTKKKEIVNIDSITEKYKNFLVNISEYSYKVLAEDKNIKSYGTYDMLKEGTRPTKDNFRNFAIDKNNLVIFFEKYQVAPYVLGEFKVEIPMKDILKNT